MLLAEHDLRVVRNECRESQAHLDGLARVQKKARDCDVVECARLDTRFLAQLTHGGDLRLLPRVDLAVHSLPRARPLAIGRALEEQHSPISAVVTDDEDLDDSWADF